VRGLLLARTLVELAIIMTHAVFADYTRAKFGWDQKATGYGMAFSGALSVLVDLGALPVLHRMQLLTELPAGLLGALTVATGLAMLAMSHTAKSFMLGLGVLSLGTSLFKSALNTLVMGCARRDEAGVVSGAMDAMEAVCRVTAPLAGGLLIENVSVEGPPYLGVGLALAGAVTLYEVAPAQHKQALLQGKTQASQQKKTA